MAQVEGYNGLEKLMRCVPEIHHARAAEKWAQLGHHKNAGQRLRILREWLVQEGLARREDAFAVDLAEDKSGNPAMEVKV